MRLPCKPSQTHRQTQSAQADRYASSDIPILGPQTHKTNYIATYSGKDQRRFAKGLVIRGWRDLTLEIDFTGRVASDLFNINAIIVHGDHRGAVK